MGDQTQASNKLFADVKFVIAECHDADSTKNLLIDNGATHINYLSDHVTLVISDVTCLEAENAMNIFEKPIVNSVWIHLSLKANKLLPPEAFCPYKNIFQNVVASFSTQLTQKDINVLACTLTYHGARVSKNIASCTHFIVPKTDINELPPENTNVKSVAPDWVLESVKQNSRCNEELFEPSLLLPPPPPRLPTPPPAPEPPREPELPKSTVPSQATPVVDTNTSPQQPRPVNTQQYQSPGQTQTGIRQQFVPNQTQVQQGTVQQQQQQSQPQRHQHVTLGMNRFEVRTYQARQMPQVRPMPSSQRYFQPQMQSQPQVTTRVQSQPQMRMLPPHTQQHQMQHANLQPQPQHQNHQQQIPIHQHQQPLNQQAQNQQQHHQHTLQHAPRQQHHLGQPNQPMMQVRHQSQPIGPGRMMRPQAVSSMIDQKQGNMRPMHSPQMGPMRHQITDQTQFDNFNQTNHHRPEYSGAPPQYQPHPRVRQPYSPMPQMQQAQMHPIQSPVHHSPVPQHQHVSPERMQPEFQPQPNMQHPNMVPQTRPVSNMQHHPHPQMQQPQPQMPIQPTALQQSPTNQHHHRHPSQVGMQIRPQSQAGVPQQAIIRHPHHPVGNHVDQRQAGMGPMHPQMTNMRQPHSEQAPYDNFNQPKFATSEAPQYQQHQRPPQTYQYPAQQPQTHRIQSPIHHALPPQQQQHISPDRPQPEAPPHHHLHQQPQHPSQNPPMQMQHIPPAQPLMHIRPQSQPGMSHQIVRPQSLGPPGQVEQRQNNVRPMLSPQLQPTMQMNSPRLIAPDDGGLPQPHPSIFDHSLESNLAQIKLKVPIVNESVQYFSHDPRQIVPKNQPLIGCKFKLIDNKDSKEPWYNAIAEAGGAFCNDLIGATHLICDTRKSDECLKAMNMGIRCVTVHWITDILALKRLTHPWKALHLPHAHAENECPLSDQIVTITNFRGRDRREVKEMIQKTGAKFTDYFSAKNTLIICGSTGGEKYDRAVEWKIPLANCQLLSDVLLLGCENLNQLLAQSKYQIFDHKDPLRFTFHPKIRVLLQPWTKPLPLTEPKIVQETPLVNGTSGIETNPAERVDQIQPKTMIEDQDAKLDIKVNGTDSGIASTPDNVKVDKSEQPSEKPTDPALDNGGLVPLIESNEMISEIKQTGDIEMAEEQKCDEKENTMTPAKQPRKSNGPIRLLFTNVAPNLVDTIQEAAAKLGLGFTSNPRDCTHLLVGQLCRTKKFVCAFSHASYILTPDWLLESSAAGELLDERPFIIQDREGEEKYSFNLVHSLVKRKRRSELIFSRWVFFLTPSIRKIVPDIEGIIESAGGSACTKKLPSKKQMEHIKAEGRQMVVVTCDEDYYLCSSLESEGAEIVGPEFVISGILRQDIDIEVHRVKKKPRLEYTNT